MLPEIVVFSTSAAPSLKCRKPPPVARAQVQRLEIEEVRALGHDLDVRAGSPPIGGLPSTTT